MNPVLKVLVPMLVLLTLVVAAQPVLADVVLDPTVVGYSSQYSGRDAAYTTDGVALSMAVHPLRLAIWCPLHGQLRILRNLDSTRIGGSPTVPVPATSRTKCRRTRALPTTI